MQLFAAGYGPAAYFHTRARTLGRGSGMNDSRSVWDSGTIQLIQEVLNIKVGIYNISDI